MSPVIPHHLADLLRRAYSAEKAAAFAYIGHRRSVKDPAEKAAIEQIEVDEWGHRQEVLAIMSRYDIRISRYYEIKYHLIGRFIGFSCHLIGWFMPFYFAGRLESGNVCEYFRMMHCFDKLGITAHDEVLYAMGMKEKEHELYFLEKLNRHPLLPFFERTFAWGRDSSLNDVDIDAKYTLAAAKTYCRSDEDPSELKIDRRSFGRNHE